MNTEGADNQKDNTGQEGFNAASQKFTFDYDVKPINDLTSAINNHSDVQKEKKESDYSIDNRGISKQDDANKIASQALWVGIINIAISAIIGISTLIVLVYSIRGVKAAVRSADAAVKQDSITRQIYKSSQMVALSWDSYTTITKINKNNNKFPDTVNVRTGIFLPYSSHRIYIQSVYYKISFNPNEDSIKLSNGFPNDLVLDSIKNVKGFCQEYTEISKYVHVLDMPVIIKNSGDSITLATKGAVLFMEVNFRNPPTGDNMKYRIIGLIEGKFNDKLIKKSLYYHTDNGLE